MDAQAHDSVLREVHVGVFEGDVEFLGECGLEVALHEGLLFLLLRTHGTLVGVALGLRALVLLLLLVLVGHAF